MRHQRPTPSAKDLRPGELAHWRELLEAKLATLGVPLIIFTFKGAATPLLGRFDGHGALGRWRLAGAKVFVMPGPVENASGSMARSQVASAGLGCDDGNPMTAAHMLGEASRRRHG